MDKRSFIKSLAVMSAPASFEKVAWGAGTGAAAHADWSLRVSVLESCSCPVFCQCFFTGKPPQPNQMEAHPGAHMDSYGDAHMSGHSDHAHAHAGAAHPFCRFNQAYQVVSGHSGSVSLDGSRFWFLGDAGDDFAKPKLEWAMLSFDSRVSQAQRTALLGVLRHLRWYRPERWKSYRIGEDAPIEWSADSRRARATLGPGGSIAEVALATMLGMQDRPVTVSNLDYFGYPRNSGFILMPSTLLAYRGPTHSFEFRDRGTNGLLTTLEMTARDFPRS